MLDWVLWEKPSVSPAHLLLATSAAMLLAAPSMAKPLPSGRPTPSELTALPDYCKARFGADENLRKAYSQRLGDEYFAHIHHHCIGLNLINRASVTMNKNDRRYFLQDAVRQFNYVLARWPKNFVLTPEAERGKASATVLLSTIPSSRR
jgi:hypothetical protein